MSSEHLGEGQFNIHVVLLLIRRVMFTVLILTNDPYCSTYSKYIIAAVSISNATTTTTLKHQKSGNKRKATILQANHRTPNTCEDVTIVYHISVAIYN
jgi:hypothetical protein